MFKVKGIYNGTTVDLLEPVSIPVNTVVEVVIEGTQPSIPSDQQAERAFMEHLSKTPTIIKISPTLSTPKSPRTQRKKIPLCVLRAFCG